MRSLALLLCPCVIAVVVHLWLANRTAFLFDFKDSVAGFKLGVELIQGDITSYLDIPPKFIDGQLLSLDVLVGVLSARHHHALRDAIRETWLGYIKQHPEFRHRLAVKFIIGRQGCPIPEEDREDPYSCTLLNLTDPANGQEVEVLPVPDPSVLARSEVSAVSLDLKVLHPIVITHLGVFPDGADMEFRGNVTVRLFQVDQKEPVVSAHFSLVSTGARVNGVWYKPVEQFILPKGFEGTLVWESLDSADLVAANVSRIQFNTDGGVLRISSVEEGKLPHRSALGFPGVAGGFMYSIYDVDALRETLRGRPARLREQLSRVRLEDEALDQESHRHGDMVFVDVIDTYRNVPSKLLQFYNWSIGNAEFSLLLKTDDDCYIDVDAVLMKMDHKKLRRSSFWWGNFRQSWAVDRVGKWQELEYSSPAYPAFACGSGYVVSRDLVEWLASNANRLKAYQGEDVSMGIWMAAIGPGKYQDSGWLCEKQCYLDMLSSPQHSPEELRALWDRKRVCGDPCGCPWGHP